MRLRYADALAGWALGLGNQAAAMLSQQGCLLRRTGRAFTCWSRACGSRRRA